MRKMDLWRMEEMEGRIKEKRGGRECNKDQELMEKNKLIKKDCQ